VIVTSLSHDAQALWHLGYADQARAVAQEAIVQAEQRGDALSQAFAHGFAAGLYQRMRNPDTAGILAAKTIQLSMQYGFDQWKAIGTFLQGWASMAQVKAEDAITQMHQGLNSLDRGGVAYPRYRALLAEAHAQVGDVEQALVLCTGTLKSALETGEQEWEAEIHRVMGEVMQMKREEQAAEAYYRQAIEAARRRQLKSLELRATVSLSRLWHRQGKSGAARQMLAQSYSGFTEGFDTVDLQEATLLLEMLSRISQ
jgi:adenylate cyclase